MVLPGTAEQQQQLATCRRGVCVCMPARRCHGRPHLLNAVATSHDQSWQARGSQRRHHGIALLVDVDLSVPAAPRLGGGEHVAAAAHVAKGSLASAVCTTTGHARDTRDGAACSPGLRRRLVASLHGHGIRLAVVLGHVCMHCVHDVRPDGGAEHRWQRGLLPGRPIQPLHADHRPRRRHRNVALELTEDDFKEAEIETGQSFVFGGRPGLTRVYCITHQARKHAISWATNA
jgi:hypothetical protein